MPGALYRGHMGSKWPGPLAGPAASDALLSRVAMVAASLETATDRSDIEHIHRLRTSLRRIRAVMRAYSPVFPREPWSALREETAELFRSTSALRDIDVQTARLTAQRTEAPRIAGDGIRSFILEYRAGEKAALSGVEDALDTFLRHDCLRAIGEWAIWARGGPVPLDFRLVDTRPEGEGRKLPAESLARRKLRRAVRGTIRAMESVAVGDAKAEALTEFEGPDLHALRLGVKKLRYTCEVFSALPGRGALRKRARVLGGIQADLGDVHDADICEAHLLEAIDGLRAGDPLAPGLTYLLGDTRARRTAALDRLCRAWTPTTLRAWLEQVPARAASGK